jgi:aspartokinase
VVDIVETALAHPGDNVAVVVSAMGGKPKVTDMLLDLVTLAAAGNTAEYTTRLAQIEQKHMEAIEVCARVCVRVCACVCALWMCTCTCVL